MTKQNGEDTGFLPLCDDVKVSGKELENWPDGHC